MNKAIVLPGLILFFFLSFAPFSRAQYASQNIDLLSRWDDPAVSAEPSHNARYSSVWGYTDPQNGRMYGIIGASNGTQVIEITDPYHPLRRAFVPGRRDSCLWREYKTYRHYLYMVSDDKAPNSLQIADLSFLPDSLHLVYDSDALFARAHTVFVDGDRLYCGSVTTKDGAYSNMSVFSLTDPLNPVLLRSLKQDYPDISIVHDMFVRNDTVYASCAYDGLYIFLFGKDQRFRMIGNITKYNDQGYNHSSVLSADGKYLVFADEIPAGLPFKIFDVSDLNDPKPVNSLNSHPGATPHNPYMIGKHVLLSCYEDGMYVYDMQNPEQAFVSGYFDTYPQNGGVFTDPPYKGCWGLYAGFANGVVLASDMQNGLFVLNASEALNDSYRDALSVYPNPVSPADRVLRMELVAEKSGIASVKLIDINGKACIGEDINIHSGPNTLLITLPAGLSRGMYLWDVAWSVKRITGKILILR